MGGLKPSPFVKNNDKKNERSSKIDVDRLSLKKSEHKENEKENVEVIPVAEPKKNDDNNVKSEKVVEGPSKEVITSQVLINSGVLFFLEIHCFNPKFLVRPLNSKLQN